MAARAGRCSARRVWDVTVTARDVERCRREVADAVRALGGGLEAVAVARLGVSELLSNVVRHVPDTRCRIEVERSGDAVVVRVVDRSPDPPVVSEPAWDAERGRGLWLLRQMVTAFGHTRVGEGKAVWFRCPPGDDGRDARAGWGP
ncbi:ATP-binding protein [Streptomyces chumphonensis]|uniref:ATP-binding protein n=1 Tax=Streptomyces chumphonensis TaxID=1214925 RepID=A0A927F096_9ACTN|nr:ATP-binding protein [Streptomyces chumphonensis]